MSVMSSKKISRSPDGKNFDADVAALERLVGGGELETEKRGEKPVKSNDRCSQEETNYRNMYSLLHRMCNHAPDMIWAKDLELRYLFANQAICDGLLKAKDAYEPIGKTDLFFALRERASQPEDPQWHTFGEICCNSDTVVLESAQPGRFEEFGNVRGKFVCLDVRKAPFFDDAGRLIGTVGCARDITREKETEQALRESEEKYRQLIENSQDCIYTLTAEGIFTFVSHAWTILLGHPVNQVIGQSFQKFVHTDDIPGCMVWLQKVIGTGERQGGIEYRIRHSDGTWYWHESNIVPLRDEVGTIIGVEGIGRDISQRKKAEDAVRVIQAKMAQDIELARRVQLELLPKLPKSPRVDVHCLYYPANIVNGDSYHLEWRNEGKLLCGFLIDVTGHGMATALQTASINVLLREGAAAKLPLLGQLRWINARAAKYFTEGAYVAMLAFELDFTLRELRYAGAGIAQFYANGTKIETPGMFVGMWEDAEFTLGVLTVSEGDTFYFLTDGFTDALAQPETAGIGLPEGEDFKAHVAMLEELAGSGTLKDDATGICLQIK